MTIDEAIVFALKQGEIFGGEMGEFLYNVEHWLEELKIIKQWKCDVVNSFCKFDANSVEEVYEKGREYERARIIENINSYIDMLVEALNDKEENPYLHKALASSRADEIRIRKLIIEQLKEKYGNTGDN